MNVKRCIKIAGVVVVGLLTAKSIADLLKLMNKLKQYEEKSLFSGTNITYSEKPFEMDSVGSLCSGLKIDFSNAEMAEKEGSLKLFARSSGVKVIVPRTWKVNLYGLINKADIKNGTEDPEEAEHVLNIDYDIKYSGVLITNSEDEILEIDEIVEDEVDEIVEGFEETVEEVIEE